MPTNDINTRAGGYQQNSLRQNVPDRQFEETQIQIIAFSQHYRNLSTEI